jgi:hypothetical protein
MARPFRIEFPGALYRVISKEWVVTQYIAKKWEDVYGFFEELDERGHSEFSRVTMRDLREETSMSIDILS